jgi:hypothetical protein
MSFGFIVLVFGKMSYFFHDVPGEVGKQVEVREKKRQLVILHPLKAHPLPLDVSSG